MTPTERLLRTADLEMQEYGDIRSPDALAAYEAQGAKPAVAVPSESAPLTTPASLKTHVAAAQLKFAAVAGLILGGLAAVVAGVLDAVVSLVHYKVTVPARCVIAQPGWQRGLYARVHMQQPWHGPSLGHRVGVSGIAVLLWLFTVIVHALPKTQQVKLAAWASSPREAPPPDASQSIHLHSQCGDAARDASAAKMLPERTSDTGYCCPACGRRETAD